MKILDCTLRDGGYYTNWDFDKETTDLYFESLDKLPIDYIEIGYRSPIMESYHGAYYYLPTHMLNDIKTKTNKKLAIILNEKDISKDIVEELLRPCIGIVSMIRLAVDPTNITRAAELAHVIKNMNVGFEIAFNVMYMSKWKNQNNFTQQLTMLNGVVDYFYMVDSYGGVYPSDIREIYNLIRPVLKMSIGFHGHNNLELALINTLTAIECGVDIIDATITGMGRGAGNLKTELLLTALNAQHNLSVNFDALSYIVDKFTTLQKEYDWGTNLAYMVSGANSLPQKEVMDWMGKRYYSANSIIRALNNRSNGVADNQKLDSFAHATNSTVLIIGGGNSVSVHIDAIREFISQHKDAVLIHASSKNSLLFNDYENTQIFCLVGNEGYRMENIFSDNLPHNLKCVLPPYPRKMGTYVPKSLSTFASELDAINFTDKYKESHTAVALQVALNIKPKHLYIIGFDGYAPNEMNEKTNDLFNENQYLFKSLHEHIIDNVNVSNIVSLTDTKYTIPTSSIYSLI